MTIDLASLNIKELFPGFNGKFIHTEKSTLAFWDIKKGSDLPIHSHFHEQVTYVLEGELELEIDGVKTVFTNQSVAVIPPNAPHKGLALTDCKVLDVFMPVREDYK